MCVCVCIYVHIVKCKNCYKNVFLKSEKVLRYWPVEHDKIYNKLISHLLVSVVWIFNLYGLCSYLFFLPLYLFFAGGGEITLLNQLKLFSTTLLFNTKNI